MKLLYTLLLSMPLYLHAQDTVAVTRLYPETDKVECIYHVLRSDTSVMYGQLRSYHLNSKLHIAGRYKNGERDGEWHSYHDNGNAESVTHYREGVYTGIWQYYSQEGLPQSAFDMDVLAHNEAKDTTPSPKYAMIAVDYPTHAVERGLEGIVKLMVLTDSMCHVAVELQSGFDPECDAAALKAVRSAVARMKFHPCQNTMTVLPIRFRLWQDQDFGMVIAETPKKKKGR